jgi:hypothetical protein
MKCLLSCLLPVVAGGPFATIAVAQQPAPAPASQPAEPPRLVVLCSVDQLASWVFDQGAPHFAKDGGFRRLLDRGVRFTHCAYQHACSETGPGHATIGTGAPAAVHGIVRNAWWSPADGKLVYCVDQEQKPLDGMPEGRNRGASRLLVPTLGDRIKAQVPGSKVASVSWKDRAAILMAGRTADCVAWVEYSTGNLVTNSAWGPAPAWLLRWNEKRVIDTFHGWVWDKLGPPAAYEGLVDDRAYELPHANGKNQHTLPQPLTGGKPEPGPPYYVEVYASPIGNEIVRLAAQACVEGMALGADATPDLLCLSFSSTDLVGHQFGPDSVEARDTLLRLDQQLGQFLKFLDGAVGDGKYAIFLTADHGVGPTPEAAKAAGLDAGRGPLQTRARANAEKALAERFGAPPAGKRYLAHVGEFSMFFDHTVLDAQRGTREPAAMLQEAARVAADAAAAAPGILKAWPTAELLAKDRAADELEQSMRAALHPERAGEVQFVIKPYWLDGMTPASHGTPHLYDREVVGLAMGGGLPAGVQIGTPVTPGFGVVLFAHLLGIEAPKDAVDTIPAELLARR